MTAPILHYQASLSLHHSGDCHLLGIAADQTLYVEELYGDDDFLAQHVLRLDGALLCSIDEDDGRTEIVPFSLPDNVIRPQPAGRTRILDFTGARQRGWQETERIREVVLPLSIQDKMALVKRGVMSVPPPMILGIADSRVLAEALLDAPDSFVVCRRLQIAYTLPQPRFDSEHQQYDYDTQAVFVAHSFNPQQDDELNLDVVLSGIGGVSLHRPMDCLIAHDRLFVADGGEQQRRSAVHIWQLVRA